MDSRTAAQRWGDSPPSAAAVLAIPWSAVGALLWATTASTFQRIRRGEGALLAVNASLVVSQGWDASRALAQALVSVLALGAMYAFNDLYDAPTDANNPKKDPALISTYLEHRRVCGTALVVAQLCILALADAALGGRATAATGGVMVVNLLYSTVFKAVPVVDVVWCALWGALYAAIVTTAPALLVAVGLMTAVCHLYQTLEDRESDAANAVVTTAVRSAALSRNVLVALAVLLGLALRAPLGDVWALSAGTPAAIFLVGANRHTGWLLTKGYFGVMWLALLAHAAG